MLEFIRTTHLLAIHIIILFIAKARHALKFLAIIIKRIILSDTLVYTRMY